MGSMSVSSCVCCMIVSCVHTVVVLNAAFCMTCSLLMLVEDARGDHMEEAPNGTANTWWICHSGYKLCRNLPPPTMETRSTGFLASMPCNPLDGWHAPHKSR